MSVLGTRYSATRRRLTVKFRVLIRTAADTAASTVRQQSAHASQSLLRCQAILELFLTVLFSHPPGRRPGIHVRARRNADRTPIRETTSTEFPYFPLCTKRPATMKSTGEDPPIHSLSCDSLQELRRSRCERKKGMKKGNGCGEDDVEIAQEARTRRLENYTSLITSTVSIVRDRRISEKVLCKLIIIRNAYYFLLSNLVIPSVM